MSIKISTLIFSYSAVPRKHIILSSIVFYLFFFFFLVLLIFVYSACLHEITDSASCRPYPSMCLASNLRDRDNLSIKDKSHAPNVSIIQRFHCMYD